MKKEKYDVFISYSRKDYVDNTCNVIPDNAISRIIEALNMAGISYWLDENKIYSGQKFVDVITEAISSSAVFVFVSSVNSNESKWTRSEIFEAFDTNKFIIPFKIDQGDYHKSLKFYLRPLDFISYYENEENALRELVRSINIIKEEIAKKLTQGDTEIISYDKVRDLKGLHFLSPLYNHIVSRQALDILYQSYKAKQASWITVYPYLLKEFRNRWFLFAAIHKDMSLRNFPLDRIVDFKVAADINWRKKADFDPEHYFDNIIGVSKKPWDVPEVITFWTSPYACRYIETKPIHPSQVLLEENEDGSRIYQIEVIVNPEMYSVFMSYGKGIRILSPEKVVRYMKKQLLDSLEAYEAQDT